MISDLYSPEERFREAIITTQVGDCSSDHLAKASYKVSKHRCIKLVKVGQLSLVQECYLMK